MAADTVSLRLDARQRLALEHGDGPLLVLGGPGAGKTRLISRRLAALAAAGTRPERVLALTPTAPAAERLRAAAEQDLAAPFEELWVCSYHQLAARLLRAEAPEGGLDPFFEPLAPADRLAMLLERLGELSLRHHEIRGDPAAVLVGLIDRIDRLKAGMVTVPELEARAAELLRQAGDDAGRVLAEREREFAELCGQHDLIVREAGSLDFGDLLLEAVRLLRDRPDVRRRAVERFDHVLADDFQDATAAQRALLWELTAEHGNLWLAADDDQGLELSGIGPRASLDEFRRLHPEAPTVVLERSHRCGRDVLDAARAVVAGIPAEDRLEKRITARREGEVRFWRCHNERAQAQAVAREIESLLATGKVAPERLCVLVDSLREEGRTVAAALEERAVPFTLGGSAAFFGRPEVRDMIAWLRLLADPGDAASVVRALTRPPVELRSVDLARCTTIARRRKLDMVSALDAALESPQLPPEARDRIQTFLKLQRSAARAFGELRPDVFVHRLVERIGLRRQQLFAAQPDTVERLINVARLGEIAAGWARRRPEASTRAFAGYLAALAELDEEEAGLPLQAGAGGPRPAGAGVQVTSLRSARGLEFDRVYILGLHAGRMPGASQRSDARRRLLYSAMTRARGTLVLAWPELAGGAPVRPSPFYEAARAVLAAEEEIHDEELFGPAESLHSTFRMMRDELLETVSRVGGELGELRLDTYMDLNRAVARYLELLKLAALIQRPSGQPVADALARINELLAQVASAEQVGELSESALDAYLLDAEREGQRRKLAIASRREPSLEAFIPRRGEGLMLSATDIQTYLTCPLKYKFARVFTIPRDPTINQRFGILIHQVLERYHQQEPASRERSAGQMRDDVARGEVNGDSELQRLLSLFDAGWRRSGFGSSDDELQFRDRAVAALARYHERHRRADSRPVWFERSFAFQLGRHHLRGRVDRVDLLPDGGYELIDYKTGRPKTARELEEDVQLAVYGLGAREAWRLEPAAQSYYYVLDDRKVAVEPPPDQASRVQQTVLEVGEGILGQDFEPRPSYEVCSWCDYRLVCPAAEC